MNEKKNSLNGESVILVSKDNKLLSISKQYNYDLVLSLEDNEYPSVFSVDLSDENLYLIIDKLYSDIKNSSNEELFYDNIIDYRSDYLDFKRASRLIITKQQGAYRIVFFKNKEKNANNNDVVISNKNSRYGNYNEPFFKMFEDLRNYNLKTKKLVK